MEDDTDLGIFLKSVKKLPPPSYGMDSNCPNFNILKNHRPASRVGLHIHLYHPVFSQFQRNFLSDDLGDLNRDDCQLAADMMVEMSRFFVDEKARTSSFSKILANHSFGFQRINFQGFILFFSSFEF